MNDRPTPNQILSKVFIYLLFFACVSSLLIFSNWESITAVNIEVGDFAANSLLIQEAKSFNLWVGNYSRVGFNHPGPAILLVLAAGESFFYDFLHAVPSPFSGQLLAVALYNAFWITLTFGAFSKIVQSQKVALIAVSTLLISFAFFDFQVFNGIWFPHLYVLPFVVMLLAASRLANGLTDLTRSLAISSGFLINGHVSFVAILGIIFIFVLISNWHSFKKTNPEKTLLNKSFLTTHAVPLLTGVAMLFVFFIPLLIQTAIDFPGPVASYAAFSGGHKPNSLMEAIQFTAAYWGGIGPFVLALLLIAVLPLLTKLGSVSAYESTRAFAYTTFGTTASLIFYAKYGVDLLDQKYIGLFYYSAPALTASFIVLAIFGAIKSPLKNIAWLFIVIATSFFLLQQIKKPAAYAVLYKTPAVIELYNNFKLLSADQQLVFDLDNSGDWGNVWSSILGVQAYAKRNHENLFCIRKNWHISFTKMARCTDAQIINGKRIFVTSEKSDNKNYGSPIFEGMNLFFYAPTTPVLERGNYSLSENHDLYRQYLLISGWSNVENEFVWSEGKESHIEVQLRDGFSGELSLDLGAFLPESSYTQDLSVYIDDKHITDASISRVAPRKIIKIPVTGHNAKRLDIKLVMRNPTSPRKFGMSADSRILGVSLYGIQIKEVQQ